MGPVATEHECQQAIPFQKISLGQKFLLNNKNKDGVFQFVADELHRLISYMDILLLKAFLRTVDSDVVVLAVSLFSVRNLGRIGHREMVQRHPNPSHCTATWA